MFLLQIIFWTSFVLIAQTYLLYPIFVRVLGSFFRPNNIIFDSNEDLPKVSILMAAHNEEKVIDAKITSILQSDYPLEKLEILIGSDCSSDATNEIIEKFALEHSQLIFFPFYERTGKIGIINHLSKNASGEIFLLTDANVMLAKNTIFELVKHFKNQSIGLVDSQMNHNNVKTDGISQQESVYISNEIKVKLAEGNIWGAMMGPFGGCFAIRASLFEDVPNSYLVDDFYINMRVLQKKFKCINEPNAMVFEDVSNNITAEFKRKIRISAGNFQNLKHFTSLLLKLNGIAFAFFSHKVLRWKTPFLILIILAIFPFLLFYSSIYLYFGYLILTFIGFILLDAITKLLSINISLFRFATHFTVMNLALLLGFFKYLKGIKTSIWEPTERLQ
jgi:cellulose synthase/poly-beta-1,6-N-acetylglucosamine synthase-like glycosyltransferase